MRFTISNEKKQRLLHKNYRLTADLYIKKHVEMYIKVYLFYFIGGQNTNMFGKWGDFIFIFLHNLLIVIGQF